MWVKNLHRILLIVVVGCSSSYSEGEMVGTWRIIEIKSEENPVSTGFLGAETVEFGDNGKYEFPGLVNERGDWTIKGNKLRLHTESVKDLSGKVMYQGHDSEWKIDINKKFMIWRGTTRFHNQNLKVLFEKGN
jgi:hypothetical protein